MKVELVAEIPVVRYAAFAEVAWLERRPELGLLCSAATDADGRITPSLVQSVLPGTSEPAARNITRWCEHLGLCDRRGSLTALGHDAAATGLAPVPEQGVYDLWVAEHPLLGSRILHALRLVSTRDQRFDGIQPAPVVPDVGVTFQSVIDPAERLAMREFMSNHGGGGCLRWDGTTSRLRVHWRWDLSQDFAANRWTLEGRLDVGKKGGRPLQHEGETAAVDPWALFAGLADRSMRSSGRWDTTERRLAVPYQDLAEAQLESFTTDVELPEAMVAGFGHFTSARVEGLPLKPATREDAQAWALARLHHRLRTGATYRSREDVRRLWALLVEGTPLEPYEPELPSHEELLAGTAENPTVYWSLAAPVDLCPEPVPEDALATMNLERSAVSAHAAPSAVRVPHRSGWSMQELVGRLVGGEARRVVLCDRFVRGEANLAMLGLLVETVRQTSDGAKVEVVTDRANEGGDNFPAIRSCIGTEPRSYHAVFGSARRNHPHDRYLLVDGAGGAFAWQMSNSPLDARTENASQATPRTPLRWRDLSATRLSVEELPVDLSRLVGGQR